MLHERAFGDYYPHWVILPTLQRATSFYRPRPLAWSLPAPSRPPRAPGDAHELVNAGWMAVKRGLNATEHILWDVGGTHRAPRSEPTPLPAASARIHLSPPLCFDVNMGHLCGLYGFLSFVSLVAHIIGPSCWTWYGGCVILN